MSNKHDELIVSASGGGIKVILACIAVSVGGGFLGTTLSPAGSVPDILEVMQESVTVANKLIEQNEKFTSEITVQNTALVNEVKHINENLGKIAEKVDAQNLNLMKDREAISGIRERINSVEKNVDRIIDRLDDPMKRMKP